MYQEPIVESLELAQVRGNIIKALNRAFEYRRMLEAYFGVPYTITYDERLRGGMTTTYTLEPKHKTTLTEAM